MSPMIKVERKVPAARNTTMPSYFDFSGVKTEEQFMSWISVTMLLLLVLFFRSSASAFINPLRERRSASTYTHMTILLYGWVLSATALTVIPHFSSHYNEITAAALFFPMMFATIAALVFGRLIIRVMYYAYDEIKQRNELKDYPHRKKKRPVMVAFQRPFRKLVRTSALCSAGVCFLFAHCWSSDMSAFKVEVEDGAGAVCRVLFSPLTFGGLMDHQETDGGHGVHESYIWCVWGAFVLVILAVHFLDEFGGKNLIQKPASLPSHPSVGSLMDLNGHQDVISRTGVSGYLSDREDSTEFIEDSSSVYSNEDDDLSEEKSTEDETLERPEGTMPMVSWYSILLVHTVFDTLIELKVFLGRFDARSLMQPAVVERSESHIEGETETSSPRRFDPSNYPPGSLFDCRPSVECNEDSSLEDKQEMWFDFVADCGDGFDSSYQVARMLAQPKLYVKSRRTPARVLPRGQFLVIGGDLAYPHPNEESYEKRFFRTFEDAMSPPPSFRREQISVRKPALPVKGWKHCFQKDVSKKQPAHELLKLYKGPSVFAIPGNHDWFDGLITYNRYILSRDWLGGWLMPQKRSYFALKLTHGWWLFAFDLGLSADIDLNQFNFFVNVVSNEMGPTDSCIVLTHEPHWVLSADEKRGPDDLPESYLRELMKHHLGRRIRARFAGDLHHYTRHVPVRPRSSEDGATQVKSLPQLIVSGGGGAFLHGTHTYEKNIRVGEDQDGYTRVCAYPDEKTSYRLGWLNMWQFRWRNWAFDMFGATIYFGVASSFFPLCGIYSDYLSFNSSHSILYLIMWLAKTVLGLMIEIFATGKISLVFTIGLAIAHYLCTDSKLKTSTRLLWGLSHTVSHVGSALVCLVFVECMTEWSIQEGIVKVLSTAKKIKRPKKDDAIDLASSLYAEYREHFSDFFSSAIPPANEGLSQDFKSQLHAQAYGLVANATTWVYERVPLIETTLDVFDLPGTIAQKHTDMCKILCSKGMDCLLRSDKRRFFLIDRGTILAYLAAMSLYFFILAIPFAGNVIGTWLALTLNVFKAQPNEGFSSLRIRHWKNFLRVHVTKDGDLEVFAIGIHRVPKRWIKDTEWDGNMSEHSARKHSGSVKTVSPSWSWERPSKWVPERHSKRFEPEIIDYTLITKTKPQRRRQHSSNGFVSFNGDSMHPSLASSASA